MKNFPAHPIPDSWLLGKTTGLSEKRISDSELVISGDGIVTKIHILLSEAKQYSHVTTYYIWGIDRASKRLVYATYDNDWEYPIDVSVRPFGAAELLNKVRTYPESVRQAFANFSEETIDNYLSVCFPYDLTVSCTMIMQEYDDFIKMAYVSHVGRLYVKVDKQAFAQWRNGKDAFACIVTREDLLSIAEQSHTDTNSTTHYDYALMYSQIIKKSPPVELENANLFHYSIFDNTLKHGLVAAPIAAQFFALFEKHAQSKR